MRCVICKKGSEEADLFEGILNAEMVRICEFCAEEEGVPILKKPSKEQLGRADESHSVRERMERLSGHRDATEISKEQVIVQGNLAKLKMPPKKQMHEDLVDDYYWRLTHARRKRKLSLSQLSEQIGIEAEKLEDIEKGKIPESFHELFLKIEAFLGIKMLKEHAAKVHFKRNIDEEKEILNHVKRKMSVPIEDEADELLGEIEHEKQEKLERIHHGDVDFSKREDLENVTLNDLVEAKRTREEHERRLRKKAKEDTLVGDDIDLDIEEI